MISLKINYLKLDYTSIVSSRLTDTSMTYLLMRPLNDRMMSSLQFSWTMKIVSSSYVGRRRSRLRWRSIL